MATPIARSSYLTAQVISNTRLTERLYALRMTLDLQPFRAGQFVRLQLPVEGELIAKPYSLVNPPHDPVAEVFFNTVPNGRLSTALAALQAGDTIEVSQPATGFFTLEELPEKPDVWMIATGTGLGPYLSILRTEAVWQRFGKVILVHGVALRAELAYRDVIEPLEHEHSGQFSYVSCVTREANPDGIEGRVTTALASRLLEQRAGQVISAADSTVMLCGNHQMIDEMKALLSERGMQKHLRHKPGHIVTEQYF